MFWGKSHVTQNPDGEKKPVRGSKRVLPPACPSISPLFLRGAPHLPSNLRSSSVEEADLSVQPSSQPSSSILVCLRLREQRGFARPNRYVLSSPSIFAHTTYLKVGNPQQSSTVHSILIPVPSVNCCTESLSREARQVLQDILLIPSLVSDVQTTGQVFDVLLLLSGHE